MDCDTSDSESHILVSSDASASSSLGLEDIRGIFPSFPSKVRASPKSSTFDHSSFSFVPLLVSSMGVSGGGV